MISKAKDKLQAARHRIFGTDGDCADEVLPAGQSGGAALQYTPTLPSRRGSAASRSCPPTREASCYITPPPHPSIERLENKAHRSKYCDWLDAHKKEVIAGFGCIKAADLS